MKTTVIIGHDPHQAKPNHADSLTPSSICDEALGTAASFSAKKIALDLRSVRDEIVESTAVSFRLTTHAMFSTDSLRLKMMNGTVSRNAREDEN